MKIKNILASAIASLAVCTSAMTPVLANDSANTTINYTVTEQYTWAAPATITFTSSGTAQSGTINVTKNVIGAGKKLTIKIDASEDFLLKDTADNDNTRTYKIKKAGTALTAGGTVLEVPAGTNTASQALSFELDAVSVEKAGTYKGTANFVSTVG